MTDEKAQNICVWETMPFHRGLVNAVLWNMYKTLYPNFLQLVKNVTKDWDMSARPLTSSNTISLPLSTYSPLVFTPLAVTIFSFQVFLYNGFRGHIVYRIIELNLRFEMRIYNSLPLLGKIDSWHPVSTLWSFPNIELDVASLTRVVFHLLYYPIPLPFPNFFCRKSLFPDLPW